MTTEEKTKNILAIVDYCRKEICPHLEHYVNVGFGDYRYNYDPNKENTEYHIEVSGHGVSIHPMGQYVDYCRTTPDTGTHYSFHYGTYAEFAEKDRSGATELLLAWPKIKSRLLEEVERIKSVENFKV